MSELKRSIRLRLVAVALATILAAMSAAGFGLVQLFEHHVERRVVAELDGNVGELIAGLSVAEDGTVRLSRRPSAPHFARPFSGTYWQVQADSKVIHRSRSLWDEALALPRDDPENRVHEHVVSGPHGRPLIAVERAIRVERAPGLLKLRFVAAQDRAETLAAVEDFATEIATMLLVLGAALMAAFTIAIGFGLAPLIRLRSDLADLRSGRTSRLAGSYPSEVALLVDDLNTLLNDRERAAERKRHRAADLAHGLKTPITAISGIAEELIQVGQPELARELLDYSGHMLRHVERELALARSFHLCTGSAPTPVRPLVDALVRSLARLPRGQDLDWVIEMPNDLALRIEPTALAEILGGLLDNARKWAKSRVQVEAKVEDARVLIRITDDGPGVADEELAELTERGRRHDRKQPGSGLGLAIASDIIEELGGDLVLTNAPGDGLSATVALALH